MTPDQAKQEAARELRFMRLALGDGVRARRVWPIVLALLTFLAGVFVGAKAYGADVVTLSVRPQIMLSRGDIHVLARIPLHADNHALTIAWSSEFGTTGETRRLLDGADDQVLHELWLRTQPPANYFFVATVFNAVGKMRGRATAEIHVPDLGDGK